MIFIVIITLSTLGQFSADIYLPSLPAIATALHGTPADLQLTIAAFMLGFSLSQLWYGPLSDRVGRKQPILIGLCLTIVGSIICTCSTSATSLIFGRLIQGLGIGVGNSVGRTIARDLFSGIRLAKFGSYLSMFGVVVIACAPTLGGYLQHYLDWQANFIFLTSYALIILLLCIIWLPETNKNKNPHATKLKNLLKNYYHLLNNKTFMGYTLCSSCAYAGIVAYLTASPFLLQKIVNLSPIQFGWLSFYIAGALFCSAFINSRLVAKIQIDGMMKYGNTLMLLGGFLMLALALIFKINTLIILVPVIIFCVGCGLNFANAFVGAVMPFPQMAGAASALFGCLQIIGSSFASTLVALLPKNNQLPLAIILIVLGLIAFCSLQYVVANKPDTAEY